MAMKRSTREMDNAYKEFVRLLDKSVEGARNYYVITPEEYTWLKKHLKVIFERHL